MVDCLSSPHLNTLKKQVDEESLFWLPIIAGIATRDEVEHATVEELQKLCIVANKKIELMGGGMHG